MSAIGSAVWLTLMLGGGILGVETGPVEEPKLHDRTPCSGPEKAATSDDSTGEDGMWTVESNGGSYCLSIRPEPLPIPTNRPFALKVRVWRSGSSNWLGEEDIELSVDARMPAHGHGMSLQPEVTGFKDGFFYVDGLLFHMRGLWRILIDIRSGGFIERAQLEMEIE